MSPIPSKLQSLINSLREGSTKLQPTDFVPYWQWEKWHEPKISAQDLATIKREAKRYKVNPANWGCPLDDSLMSPNGGRIDLPPRQSKSAILRPYRKEYIEKCMQEMPAKIEAWREQKRLAKEANRKSSPF